MLEMVKWQIICISIHTLRMEGDFPFPISSLFVYLFQSTPSAWRVTSSNMVAHVHTHISIHTLRMEGDPNPNNFFPQGYISIHTLRMEGDPQMAE